MNLALKSTFPWIVAAACGVAGCGGPLPEDEVTEADSEAIATASQELANGPCAAAYNRLVRHVAIGDLGWLNIYYAPSENRYCAVNMAAKASWDSKRGRYIEVDRGTHASRQRDSGRYRFYAGPIYLDTEGGCVRVSGGIQVTETSSLGIGSSARYCE